MKYKFDFNNEFDNEMYAEGTSPYIAFTKVIAGRCLSRDLIRKWYTKLVPKEDYSKSDLSDLLDYLEKLSNKKL